MESSLGVICVFCIGVTVNKVLTFDLRAKLFAFFSPFFFFLFSFLFLNMSIVTMACKER